MARKWVYRVILSVMVVVLVPGLALQLMSKTMVTHFLDHNIPEHIRLEYNSLKTNVLYGSIGLVGVNVEWSNRETAGVYGILRMDTLRLSGLGYFDLLFQNTLRVDHIEFVRPDISYAPFRHFFKKDTIKNGKARSKWELAVARIDIVEGEFTELGEGPDSIKLQAKKLFLAVEDLKTNGELLGNKIPFIYGDYVLAMGKLRVDLGPFERLEVDNAAISDGDMLLNGLLLASKHTKGELSGLLGHERDHIDLRIPEIRFSGLDFGFKGDRYFLNVESATLDGADLEIYRDKLVADDLKEKKMYGQLLREMPFDMDIGWLNIKKGRIAYAERVAEDAVPGEISFAEVEADLKAISNTRRGGTNIEINAKLMGEAPLLLKWDFDSKEQHDAFLVSGKISDFRAASLNPFLKSNLRAEAKGDVKELYFTISGDAISAKGDMKMRYRDFSFSILQKDRVGVNRLLTAIGNMFVNNGSKADVEGYRHGDIQAERDATKSFFNYLWLSVKSGILSTLTGDGRK